MICVLQLHTYYLETKVTIICYISYSYILLRNKVTINILSYILLRNNILNWLLLLHNHAIHAYIATSGSSSNELLRYVTCHISNTLLLTVK